MPEVGFEPTKHFAAHLECAPFDHSGTPATDPRPSSSNIILPHRKLPVDYDEHSQSPEIIRR